MTLQKNIINQMQKISKTLFNSFKKKLNIFTEKQIQENQAYHAYNIGH